MGWLNQTCCRPLSNPWSDTESQRIWSISSLSRDGGSPCAGRSSRSSVTIAARVRRSCSLAVTAMLIAPPFPDEFHGTPAASAWISVDHRIADAPGACTHWRVTDRAASRRRPVMNPIRQIRRIAGVLAGACALLAFAAASPAMAARIPVPVPWVGVPEPYPGANLPPAPVPPQIHAVTRTVLAGGMPGWQITLIAVGAPGGGAARRASPTPRAGGAAALRAGVGAAPGHPAGAARRHVIATAA